MFAASFTDSELETLLVALRYWRHHRGNAATRRGDRVLAAEEVEVLLAKLGSARLHRRTIDDDVVPDRLPH